MSAQEAEALAQALLALQGKRAALLIVVATQGSTYRRSGAKLLVDEEGKTLGAISGGCVEGMILQAAQEALAGKAPLLLRLDLEDESVFGYLVGCPGKLALLVQEVSQNPLWLLWAKSVLAQEKGAMLLGVSGELHGKTLFFQENHAMGDEALKKAWGEEALPAFPKLVSTPLGEVFCDPVCLRLPLVVFGGGLDVLPLLRLAQAYGFSPLAVEPREAFASRLAEAGFRVLQASPREVHLRDFPENAFVVIMNHHLQRDAESLEAACHMKPRYLGALGPKSRWEKILSRKNPLPCTLFNPVGLDIGSESAGEVALAVVAEMLAVARGRQGGFLREKSGFIHHHG